jgi:transposase
MSQQLDSNVAAIEIDIGKNSFRIVGQDRRGALVLRQKWSRGQVEARLANLPPCLIGLEACSGAHHLSRKLRALGHDAPRWVKNGHPGLARSWSLVAPKADGHVAKSSPTN